MITLNQEDHVDNHIPIASIKVVGVGGAGNNTVNCMVESDYKGVEFIAVNTDAQSLKMSKAHHKIQVGLKSTKGLGAGASPEMGRRALEEDLDKVMDQIGEADIVFVTGGMGGGTGSGAVPVLVNALKERGILTIVVVTKPFAFEGRRRANIAEEALNEIKDHADTLLIIPNQKLLDLVDEEVSMIDGFAMINEVLNRSVKGVSDIITRAGHINVDYADVRVIMKDQGLAVMGTGRAAGQDRAKKAVLEAISSPLLENMDIGGAKGVLLNITGGSNLGLHEISAAASVIYEQADEDANIILGSVIDDSLGDEVVVTVIATGFPSHHMNDVKVQATVLAKDSGGEIADKKAPEQPREEKREQPQQQLQQVPQPQPVPVQELAPAQEQLQAPVQQPEPVQQVASAPVQEQPQQELRSQEAPVAVEQAQVEEIRLDVRDLDVPTFMRKEHFKNKNKKHHKNRHYNNQQDRQDNR